MKWFGEPWPEPNYRAPVCEDDALQVPTPTGETCLLCQEPIVDGDRGTTMGCRGTRAPSSSRAISRFVHIECSLRSVMGNHLHVSGQCRHLGDCNERSTLTYRQEALEVWRLQGH